MLNTATLKNVLNFTAQVRLLYQKPSRNPQPITFDADSVINCATLTPALGQRLTFSGGVPTAIATGTFYAVPVLGGGFKVATTLANAVATTPVTVTITGGISGQVFDLDILPEDPADVLLSYQVLEINPISIGEPLTKTYNDITKKTLAVYSPAVFIGTPISTPVSHTFTSFAGLPGDNTFFYDLSPTTQPSVPANGSLTVIIAMEAEAT